MKAVLPGRNAAQPLLWVLLVLSGVGIVVAITMIVLLQPRSATSINDFQACKEAGGAIAESYPEQCFLNGASFVNDAQQVEGIDRYLGLSEHKAVVVADQSGVAHRVVERDGEAQPVTMDYIPGRLNMYVKEGVVYKVDVEGE